MKVENRNKIKVHDSIIKELLDTKEEFKDFIKDFLRIPIENEDIEQFNREYRTRIGLGTKYIDILYKIKGEETYILLEHQSKVDYSMPERMSEYSIVVVRCVEGENRKNKNKTIPLIYPCVLNTSKKKWDAPRTIKHTGNNRLRFPDQTYPKYFVVDINDYTVEKLLSKRTGIGVVMAFEKIETQKELDYIIKILKEIGEINEREKMAMRLIIENIEQVLPKLRKNNTEEKIEKLKEEMMKIINKGGDFMSNFEKTLKKIIKENDSKAREEGIVQGREEGIAQGREEGIAQGRAEGITQGISQVIKEMIRNKENDEKIIQYTHISKKELEELKLQMA